MHLYSGAFAGQVCSDALTQRKDERGYFFRAWQCAGVPSFRVGKMLFCMKRVCFLQILQNGVGVLIFYIGEG